MLDKVVLFKNVCPYLGHTKLSTLRSLSTHASKTCPAVSSLTLKTAQSCPVMGPALVTRAQQLVHTAGYASVAECPHAAKTQAAAAAEEATRAKCPVAHGMLGTSPVKAQAEAHHKAQVKEQQQENKSAFNYDSFYNAELDKKHKGIGSSTL